MMESSPKMIGPYRLGAKLGEGGMGEVWQATDTRLDRQVAIKLLPPGCADDPMRLARIEREAKLLAALNHPNIGAIYGLEDSDGRRALIMELVVGQTLAQRIAAAARPGPPLRPGSAAPSRASSGNVRSGSDGKPTNAVAPRVGSAPRPTDAAIPLDEVLEIARQIAEALEYAHERGVVHRDLKPANVMVTPAGAVKVLDFGLAKALLPEGSDPDLLDSPTLSVAATQAGMILGTAAYMSPEQAKGKPVDRRCDIWAFGCVLFEMLAGQRPFAGDSVTDILAAVILKEPNWELLPAATPPALERLIRRCLAKDARQRLRDIGEARLALEELQRGEGREPEPSEAAAAAPARAAFPARRRILPWVLTGFASAGLLIAVSFLWRAADAAPAAPVELNLALPASQRLHTTDGPAAVISPDGKRIAYVVDEAGRFRIYLRDLSQSRATALNAYGVAPFFSPDGRWLGFYTDDNKLEKISVFGGAPIVLTDANSTRGATWGRDGTIIFPNSVVSGLYRVSAAGGTATPFTRLDMATHQVTQRWPQFLPGDQYVLFTASADNQDFSKADIEAASLANGKIRVLVKNAYFGRYLSSGYLAYVSGGSLFVVRFDPRRLKPSGPAVPMLQNLQTDLTNGSAQLSFSNNGTAIYLTGKARTPQVTVDLVDQQGHAQPMVRQPGNYTSPRFSPDGKRLALVSNGNILIYDLARKTLTPLTFSSPFCANPVWAPDGRRIACARRTGPHGNSLGISWLPADGTGGMQTLTDGMEFPSSWSPDGKTLAITRISPSGSFEIATIQIDSSGQPQRARLFLTTDSASGFPPAPSFSPDGRWIAYTQTVLETPQVFVVPFPGPGGKWQISTNGGILPVWSKTGNEIFYDVPASTVYMNAVHYHVQGNSFEPGTPIPLFHNDGEDRFPLSFYDATPDGRRFALLMPVRSSTGQPAAAPDVVLHWFSRVDQMAAAARSANP